MAECRKHRGKFSEYIDGVLDPQERRALEEHLAGCAACRRERDAWRRLVADVAGLPGPDAPDGFTGRVLDRLGEARSAAAGPVVSMLWYRALPVAALIMVVLGLTFAVNRPVAVEPRSVERLAMARAVQAPGEEASARTAGDSVAAVSAIMDGRVPLKDDGTRLMDALYGAVKPPAAETEHFAFKEAAGAPVLDGPERRRAERDRSAREDATLTGEMAEEELDVNGQAQHLGGGGGRGPSRQAVLAGGLMEAPTALVQVQFFNQVAPAVALQFRTPAQQVLTLVADDQATLASQVVLVANSNGLQPALAFDTAAGKGAMELHLSVPAERYPAVLRQLSDLATPQRQNLANTDAAKGRFFADALRDYGTYQSVRDSKADGKALTKAVAAPLLAASMGTERAPVDVEVAAEVRLRTTPATEVARREAGRRPVGEVTGELNLVVRVVRPEGTEQAGR